MQALFESNFITYFVQFLEVHERITLRKVCRDTTKLVEKQNGFTNEIIRLCEYSKDYRLSLDNCADCSLLFEDLDAHIEQFPYHDYELFTYHSKQDMNAGLEFSRRDLDDFMLCDKMSIQTNYGRVDIDRIKMRAVCARGIFRNQYIRLENCYIFFVGGRAYMKLIMGKSKLTKFAAILRIEMEKKQKPLDEKMSFTLDRFAHLAGLI